LLRILFHRIENGGAIYPEAEFNVTGLNISAVHSRVSGM
jgi:hypothetical protein